MNESVKEVLMPYLKSLLEAANKGIELAQQEIPLLVNEWLTYLAVKHWMLFILGIIMLLSTIPFVKMGLKESEKDWLEQEDGKIVISIVYSILMTIIGVLLISSNVMEAIQVTFFPRVYLLEQAINLIH